jgi:hypothetical protein
LATCPVLSRIFGPGSCVGGINDGSATQGDRYQSKPSATVSAGPLLEEALCFKVSWMLVPSERARTTRELEFLQLRGRAAMRAGTVNAIGSADHNLSQAWSRHFYEDPDGIYGPIDGVHWASAVNGDPVVALYERARDALEVPAGHDAPLDDPAVLTIVRRIAHQHALLVST